MATQSQKQVLSTRIAASRIALVADVEALRRRLDVPARVKDSILAKPLAWLGGSLGAGYLTSMVIKRPRRQKEIRRRGLWSLALGGAFTLARPALQSWALRGLQGRFLSARKASDPYS